MSNTHTFCKSTKLEIYVFDNFGKDGHRQTPNNRPMKSWKSWIWNQDLDMDMDMDMEILKKHEMAIW